MSGGHEGFLDALESGVLRWDPSSPRTARSLRDRELIGEVGEFTERTVDPGDVDRDRRLPGGFIDGARARGYLKLRNDADLGGHVLTDYEAYCVIERAARWSVTAGQFLGHQNALGPGALALVVPPGPIRDLLRQRARTNTIGAFAVTEPGGFNNTMPTTTATVSGSGSAFVLHGEKRFIGCGAIAGVFAVAVTVRDGSPPRPAVAFVPGGTEGLSPVCDLEYMGSKGLPSAGFVLDGVFVPRDHVIVGVPADVRVPSAFAPTAQLTDFYFTIAPAAAICGELLDCAREFLARRQVDARALLDHDAIQRFVAASLADRFAIDAVARWCLLGSGPGDLPFERMLAKNICTRAAWRVADRTISLLGAEGYETETSKRERGAWPAPVERLFRDARGLRVAGNVDFVRDIMAGRSLLARFRARFQETATSHPVDDLNLSSANRGHLAALADGVRELADHAAALAAGAPPPPPERQHELMIVGRIAAELFTVCAVLREATRTSAGQIMADVYCRRAWLRLDSLWRDLQCRWSPPGLSVLIQAWLHDELATASVGDMEAVLPKWRNRSVAST
jgi:alkylation response protein AidB-like acyl-CoA dehydrogenase